MEWIEKHPKKSKPTYEELLAFLPDKISEMFLIFNNEMAEKYKVYNNYPRFENTTGWTYGYCRGYRIELLYVTIGNSYFTVLGVKIEDESSLKNALEKVRIKYDVGYEERYARLTAAKKDNQIKRAKRG